MKDERDYNLLRHNTFGIEAKCSRFVEFGSVEELQSIIRRGELQSQKLLMIGSGSNLLLTRDFDGIVLHSAIVGIEQTEECVQNSVLVRCGSGERWDYFVSKCIERGWFGAENLSFIPGEVGASAVQNIGAYGVEAKDLIQEVAVVSLQTGETKTFTNQECKYSYRDSAFKHEWKGKYIITHVTYKMSKTFRPNLSYKDVAVAIKACGESNLSALDIRKVVHDIRNSKIPDPSIVGNAGSFFMNPIISKARYEELSTKFGDMPCYELGSEKVKISAGWLIDKCGWKGKSLGKAAVHDNQALVLINLGGATGDDIVALCEKIQEDVFHKFGVVLQPEVNIV